MAEEEMKGEQGLPATFPRHSEASSLVVDSDSEETPVKGVGQRRKISGTKERQREEDAKWRRKAITDVSNEATNLRGGRRERCEDAVSPQGHSFTGAEVEALIQSACSGAIGHEGSHQANELGDSQAWHQLMRRLFAKPSESQAAASESRTFSELGGLLYDVLDLLRCPKTCRPVSTVGSRDLFPLPIPDITTGSFSSGAFLRAAVEALNSLHGVQSAGRGNPTSLRAVKRLDRLLSESGLLEGEVPRVSFKDFFATRGVDYVGEEVKLAKPIVWEEIELSLPAQVGTLDIRDFCEQGVLHYVEHFEESLVPLDRRVVGKTPTVMCSDPEWEKVCCGLLQRGLCEVVFENELFEVQGKPVLNGMFAVSKQEFSGNIEACRLIMNLKPLNSNTRALQGNTGTLPMVSQMGSFYLADDEILCTSSEDLRCFFYLFAVPKAWTRYMGFGKPVPQSLLPPNADGRRGFLASRVLPMGYINSVGVAQHIHRNVVRRAMGSLASPLGAQAEIRRDRLASSAAKQYRVYLDNFDMIERLDRQTADKVRGTVAPEVEQLREVYQACNLPVHPKKSVLREWAAEVQGAWLDGEAGTCRAKPQKIFKYVGLALELVRGGNASQKELQVVGGGLVYISMFRRSLLCGLNKIWETIVAMGKFPPSVRRPLSKELTLELVRFVCLLPLAFMNFRSPFDDVVSVSDASTSGGGFCVSVGTTQFGNAAAQCDVRGDVPEEQDMVQLLTVGLFDGIAALRVAVDSLGAPVAGHISVEKDPAARRVTEANFPDSIFVDDVVEVTLEVVKDWSFRFSSVGVILVGAGPPCQGVSGLNFDRKGALKDARSCLYVHVKRIVDLFRCCFPWAQVHFLGENVASMDYEDCSVMNDSYEVLPWYIDAAGLSLSHRPRVYCVSWELFGGEGITFLWGSDGRLPIAGEVQLSVPVVESDFLEEGCQRVSSSPLPTFTTARPSPVPLRRPAGLSSCQEHEKERWAQDSHKFPPYQYKDCNCVKDKGGVIRPPSVVEREAILGFPVGFTFQCLKKAEHFSLRHVNQRLSLLGNSWSIPVVAWLISCLLAPLGLVKPVSLESLVLRLTPGKATHLSSLLSRPPLSGMCGTCSPSQLLVQKLAGMVSLKGEDVLLQHATDVPVRYHRLRASLPARLWKWRAICGWRWTGTPEHINVLELRSVLTTMKYRIEKLGQFNLRCLHMVDSLVVLHALCRGRSSSRKMKRTMMRLNSLLLVAGLQPVWAYVDTHQNPADAPSRRFVKRRWGKKPRK